MPSIAKLQARLVDAIVDLGVDGLSYVEQAIAWSSRQRDITYTGDDGTTEIIRLLPIPSLLARADLDYVHGLCTTLNSCFAKTVRVRCNDDGPMGKTLRDVLRLDPEEEEWLALAPPGRMPTVARWDMNIDPARGGARAAKLFELNGVAVGGIHYGPTSSEVVHEWTRPLLDGIAVGFPAPMRDVWHQRLQGRKAVWLEDRDWETGITEGPSLARHYHDVVVADPRDFVRTRGGEYLRGKQRVDLFYRAIEIADLCAIEQEDGKPLAVLRQAVVDGKVISPIEADLDHKSLLEVFSRPDCARLFSAAEQAALRKHVPWTRLLGERRTEGRDGKRMIDLPEYAVAERERLVYKPNRSCGGEGIMIGRDTSAAAWTRAVERSVAGSTTGEAAVVQELVDAATMDVPVLRGKRVAVERLYVTYGMMSSDVAGPGVLGRASPLPVVNVSRGGGLVGVLAVES